MMQFIEKEIKLPSFTLESQSFETHKYNKVRSNPLPWDGGVVTLI